MIEVSAESVRSAISDDLQRIRKTLMVDDIVFASAFDGLADRVVARGPFVDIAALSEAVYRETLAALVKVGAVPVIFDTAGSA